MAFIFSKYWGCLILEYVVRHHIRSLSLSCTVTCITSPHQPLQGSYMVWQAQGGGRGFLADPFLSRQEAIWAESTQEVLLTVCREKHDSKTPRAVKEDRDARLTQTLWVEELPHVSTLELGSNKNTDYYVFNKMLILNAIEGRKKKKEIEWWRVKKGINC